MLKKINGTQYFKRVKKEQNEVRKVLQDVYEALSEKGYNPKSQIVGYILSGDPTYITSHKNARTMLSKMERDEILEELVESYINANLKK